MIRISEITYEQILPLWSLLWANRVSAIESTSAMVLPVDQNNIREYTTIIGTPIFIGAFDGELLVGVNSLHNIGDSQTRSRGLYVLGSHRHHGIANKLLHATMVRCPIGNVMWSYPNYDSLVVYLKAGFRQISEPLIDELEHKTNYYVIVK